jgi:murein L,D-transpeptidase YafK
MKNTLILTSVLLGCGLMMTGTHQTKSASYATNAATTTSAAVASKRTWDIANGNGPVGSISIMVDKSDYSLSVYDQKGWYATYPVVFGNNSLEDKKMEGDNNTPEGTFRITHKKPHDKWDRFMGIDYPTKESWEKFRLRKQRGEIPAKASIGGAIGIHGTWPREDFVIDKYKNWTMGCISMKRSEVEELYNYTPVGTQVTIRK